MNECTQEESETLPPVTPALLPWKALSATEQPQTIYNVFNELQRNDGRENSISYRPELGKYAFW
jgi:hypothetical protein